MNKRVFGIIFILFLILGTVVVVRAITKPTPKVAGTKSNEKTVRTSNDKETANEAKTDTQATSVTQDLASCLAPDGKTSQASQFDCDNLLTFWKNHPAASVPSTSPSSDSSSTPELAIAIVESVKVSMPVTPIATPTPTVMPTPNVTPTPKPEKTPKMEITSVKEGRCDSSSCAGWLTTLIITGKNFTKDSRVVLSHHGRTQASTYVGGNGKTQIYTDFYYLPEHTTFDVTVSDPHRASVTLRNAFSTEHHSDEHGRDR